MMKNVKKIIFVAGGFSRFFIWSLLGPQWTHSNSFCSDCSIFNKKKFSSYIYKYSLYAKIKIFVAGGGHSFFFGDYWDSNETIPTGFALIADFTENPPLFIYFFWKKKWVCSGGGIRGFCMVVIGTPMNTFWQVSLWF